MGSKILFSAFSDEYENSIDGQIKALKKFGINKIELRFADQENVSLISLQNAKKIRTKLDNANLTPSALGSPIGKVDLDINMYEYEDTVKRVFENACILGAEKVRIFSFYLKNKTRTESKSKVLENLNRILDIADTYKLILCHENEADIYGESPEQCEEILKAFNGRLRCVFDMGNFVLGGYNPIEAYKKLLPYIEYFHIKDAKFSGEIVAPGLGDGNIHEILRNYTKKTDKPVIATLEPHLTDFLGLSVLTGKKLNVATSDADKSIFEDAVNRYKKILERINLCEC